ncbi:hypothetical protein KY320_01100 [Candidatus Woesearchaeota archaeon]|nr:hypothetical protein [Candidatus Woesearchaeota archaeon]
MTRGKGILAIFEAIALMMPMVLATSYGTGINISIVTEAFSPRLWMCDSRVVLDDDLQWGRIQGEPVCSIKDDAEPFDPEVCDPECCDLWQCDTGALGATCSVHADCTADPSLVGCWCHTDSGCFLKGPELIERHNNYAFEGEKVEWLVLVMDKNKIEEIEDVVVKVGAVQGSGLTEVECLAVGGFSEILPECNARIDEEVLTEFDSQIMGYYECTLTVETPATMHGEYWVSVEATDDGTIWVAADEQEYWFLNPVVALTLDGLPLLFGTVRPGTISYSNSILVGNGAEAGSGVMMDMFISGTDFYDPANSGARCVITNRLKLGNNYVASGESSNDNVCQIGFTDTADHLCYYAVSGAYGTQNDPRSDAEGYAPIVYGDAFIRDFYNDAEIIQDGLMGAYYMGNMLSPGSEMSITFKLGLPLPCVGDFSQGSIYFWGEAV